MFYWFDTKLIRLKVGKGILQGYCQISMFCIYNYAQVCQYFANPGEFEKLMESVSWVIDFGWFLHPRTLMHQAGPRVVI